METNRQPKILVLLLLSIICFTAVGDDLVERRFVEVVDRDGYRVDFCLSWGAECGAPAADAFCRMRGFQSASSYDQARNIGATTPTRTLSDRRICNQAHCDGFSSVTCQGASGGARSPDGVSGGLNDALIRTLGERGNESETRMYANRREIQLDDIRSPLVPMTLLQGDREFGGNGPEIYVSTNLEISDDRRQIIANVFFRATETKADWSKTGERFFVPVYQAPDGSTIRNIEGETRSVAEFVSKPAGLQLGAPTEDVFGAMEWIGTLFLEATNMNDATIPDGLPCKTVGQCRDLMLRGLLFMNTGNHVHVVPSDTGGPVESFWVVGDTGGDDISDDRNGKDDTRIVGITFRPIVIQYESGN